MYPVLIQFKNFRLDSYGVIWLIALCISINWSISRLKIYGLDEDKSRNVMFWSFIFTLIGARVPEYIYHYKFYVSNPSEIFNLTRGDLHEVGAVSGALISALIFCLIRKVNFYKLCEVACIPAFFSIAVGRWGCFLNGCCVGLQTASNFGVHFPRDAINFFRHPVQIYYSIFAFGCVIILKFIEKFLNPARKFSIIAPIALILYSVMRFSLAQFREYFDIELLIKYNMSYKLFFWIMIAGIIWLLYSLVMNVRGRKSKKNS